LKERNLVEEKLEEAHNLVKDRNHIILNHILYIMKFIKSIKRVFSFYAFLLSFAIYSPLSLQASTLQLSISSNPTRLNPILSTDSASSTISNWIFTGLFKYDKDGAITTDMASSYYFEDNKTLIIKLKKNIKWHDDENFTAQDVLFTYQTILNPKIFTPYASDYKKYIKDVKMIDDYTIKIIYHKPYFKALELWMMGILPYHILKDEKDLMTSDFNKHPIGTGSYKLEKIVFSSNILLKANGNFYDGKPKIEFINYKFIADNNTDFLLQKQGKLDISSLSPLQIDRQIDSDFRNNYKIIETQSFGYSYMGYNLKNPKFKD
jgi:peptide/nickel transport system substrate-binding protein